MKKLNAYWVTLIVIVSIVAGYYTYHKVIIKNVFEEMYDSYYSFTVLGSIDDMPQIESISRDEKILDAISIYYKENKNDNKIWISLTNYEDIQSISIINSILISEETYLDVIYIYDVNTHKLENSIAFHGENAPRTENDQKQTKELLEKYNISKEYLQENSDKLLDTVLTDWKNYSGSSYSKDNMGRLTIEKDEFLRQQIKYR